MTVQTEIAQEAWDDLHDKRARLKEATEHYDLKVQAFKADECKLEEVTQAFEQKQQASQEHAAAFHQLFKV